MLGEVWLQPEGGLGHDSVMQELLSRPGDEKAELCDQGFYELRLDDAEWNGETVYRLCEAHARWHDAAGSIVWDEKEFEQLPTLELARERYEIRREKLMRKGFTYSDMDL